MDAFILAGGMGRRLGSLTANQQKATLCFEGSPLITHVISGLLEQRIKKILILTGYHRNDVHAVLETSYASYLRSGKITILDFPDIQGTLSRLCAGLGTYQPQAGCCVCGIDSLVSSNVLERFLWSTKEHSDNMTLLLSPRLKIAPTHKVACLNGDRLVTYLPAEYIRHPRDLANTTCYTDVGIRYFPLRLLERISHGQRANGLFIPMQIQELITSGITVCGCVFQDRWKHFAVLEDFYSSFAS